MALLLAGVGRAIADEPAPHLGYFGGQLVNELEESILGGGSVLPAEIGSAVMEILSREQVDEWTNRYQSSWITVPGGSAIFYSAGEYEGSLRDLDGPREEAAQDVLDTLFSDRDVDKAVALLLEFTGSGVSKADSIAGRLAEVETAARRRLAYYGQQPDGREFLSAEEDYSIVVSWDPAQLTATLRVDISQSGRWAEITAPFSLALFSNPVHLTPILRPTEREIRFGDAAASTAKAGDEASESIEITSLMHQVIGLEAQLTELTCDGHLWENSDTGVVTCTADKTAPAGRQRLIGPSTARPAIASIVGKELQGSIDMLKGAMSPAERSFFEADVSPEMATRHTASTPAALATCADRASQHPVSQAVLGSSVGSGMLTFECGSIQSFGHEIRVNVALPPDLYEISERKLALRLAASSMRGGGVNPGYRLMQRKLEAPSTQVSLGVLPPGYYRVSVRGELTGDLLADRWLLITVEQRPGSLRVANDPPPPPGEAAVLFDAPVLSRDPDDPGAPRYAIDVVQIRRDGTPRKRWAGDQATHDFEAFPRRILRLNSTHVAPGANRVSLLIRSGDRRYVIDTLNVEVEQPPVATLHYALNGEARLIDADLTVVAGEPVTVEFGGPLAPFGSMATLRLHRLHDFDPDHPSARQFAQAHATGNPLGEVVAQQAPVRLKELTAWTLEPMIDHGRYAIGIEMPATGQIWYLYFGVEARAPGVLSLEDTYQLEKPIALPGELPAEALVSGGQIGYRAFRLGQHVPGCAFERDQQVEARGASFRPSSPGLYLLRLVRRHSGGRETTLDSAAVEIVSEVSAATITAEDRREAARNPWSFVPDAGENCATVGTTDEDISLHLVAFREGAFTEIEGPANYGQPYYLEGRLEKPARNLSYLAAIADPGGIPRTVRLYRLDNEPARLRSDIIYFVWDHYEATNAP